MNFEQQKQKIQEMINDGQQRVEAISTKYNNYINENKQISTELEQLVKKLKECTGNLGKIGEAYQRSKEETKKMEEDFTSKVQESNADSERRNKEAEERIQKQKQDLETAAAAQKQDLETKIQEQHAADEALLAQQKKDNEEAMNELKKQKQEADVLAAQKMEQAKTEATQSLEAQQKAAEAKLMKQHEFDEAAKANVRMQLEEFKQKSLQELEDLKNEAAATKQTSDDAHKEQLAQQKTQNDELLLKKDETHKAAIEKMKSEFDKSQEELKSTLEGTQSTALEEAKQKCQQERQNLVDQIETFKQNIKQLTDNQDEEVKISLQGFKDTVTETCTKIQEIQDKIPAGAKEEEAPPQLKTEEAPVGPKPPPIPTPEEEALLKARNKAGDQAERDKIYAKMPPNFAHLPRLRSGGSGINPNWLFQHNDFAYEMCANRNDGPDKCTDEVIEKENKRVLDAFAPFLQDTAARQRYEQHVKYAFIELKLAMEKQGLHDDKHDHKLRVWMRVWFMKYIMAFPEKQKTIPTVEEHKQWYDRNLKYQVDVNNYNRIAKNLDKLGHGVKHSGRRGRRHSKHRSPRSSSAPPKGGFRYGMKIPRRRTLRSKLKTQRLKSVKKNRKRKGKKSRKKRRRKKTAKNKK
jgi:hypothetical protein